MWNNFSEIERSHYAYDLVTEMLKNKTDRISSSNIVKQLTSEKNKVNITLHARSCIYHRIF